MLGDAAMVCAKELDEKSDMKFYLSLFVLGATLFMSCGNEQQTNSNASLSAAEFQNKAHQIVYDMVQKVGNHEKLSSKKSVEYTYTYQTPDGKMDVSNEKYIFDGELSYGKYEKHQRSFPQFEGVVEQGFDGQEYWLKHDGKVITDEAIIKRVAFTRPTNYYWFAMMQKLLDPGLNYQHIGVTEIDSQPYDVVRVSFDSEENELKDIYQLYINQRTSLVDQFLFTVADFGKMETPNLMKLEYEEVDGFLVPSKRLYKKSTWNAAVSESEWVSVTWSDIKFNTAITKQDFKP